MLEKSFGISFFLKNAKNTKKTRYIYLRVTVDGMPKEISTKRMWYMDRWNQSTERAIGTKEDARAINYFLDSIVAKINNHKTELINNDTTITSKRIIDYISGNIAPKAKVLEEFQKHNDEMLALIATGQYSKGTYQRYTITYTHIQKFILFKYKTEDLEFRELDYDFITSFDFYLRTEKKCSINTSLKYISNFKKIVFRAVAKKIISSDPFYSFKFRKTKPNKKPLTKIELQSIENQIFTSERLTVIRDIFVFMCYTGLAYIDTYNLKKSNIKIGIDGRSWIMSQRQKSKSTTDIPLLPKALEIIEKYKNDPICIARKSVLPVKSNQRTNEYLKEIADLCGIHSVLNTHKARRTFASTVTLSNGVPIHIVKEMLGHSSVRQTEEYAITQQESISSEMQLLREKLIVEKPHENEAYYSLIQKIEKDLELIKLKNQDISILKNIEKEVLKIKKSLLK